MLNVVINMFPPAFRLHPDYSVRLNNELKAQPLGNRSWLTGQPQGQLFQAQMKDIGVEIKIANTDSTKLFAISSSQDTYRTGGGSNYGQSASKKVDQLFAQAVREVDEARSAELATRSTSS